MISRLSEALVKRLIKVKVVLPDDEDLYNYGMFMIISYLMFFALTLVFGVILKIPVESVIFYITFCIIRGYAGGIHANTEAKCTFFTSVSILSSELVIKLFIENNFIILSSIVIVLSVICLFLFSPLTNEQKEFSCTEKAYLKKATILFAFLALLICIVCFIINKFCSFGIAVSIGVSLSALLLVLGKIKQVIQR